MLTSPPLTVLVRRSYGPVASSALARAALIRIRSAPVRIICAASPVCVLRCDHFTTLAILTLNVAARPPGSMAGRQPRLHFQDRTRGARRFKRVRLALEAFRRAASLNLLPS